MLESWNARMPEMPECQCTRSQRAKARSAQNNLNFPGSLHEHLNLTILFLESLICRCTGSYHNILTNEECQYYLEDQNTSLEYNMEIARCFTTVVSWLNFLVII